MMRVAVAIGLAVATLEAAPAVIIEREGGMGLGSALIIARVVQVGALAAATIVGGYLVDRRGMTFVLLGGAVASYAGATASAATPHGALDWVIAAFVVTGTGVGLLLAAGFASAATVDRRERPVAIATLLLAVLAGTALGPPLAVTGPGGLVVSAVLVIGASLLAAGRLRDIDRRSLAGAAATDDRPISGRRATAGAALLAAGVLACLAGADPSRLTAATFARPLGVDLGTLDVARGAFVVAGVGATVAAVAVLLAGRSQARLVAAATAGTALAATSVSGTVAALSLAASIETLPRASAVVVVAGLAGAALGLAAGAWWLSRSGAPQRAAAVGALVLSAAALVGLVPLALGWTAVPSAALVALIAIAAAAGGAAAAAFRLVLAEVPVGQLGLAAALGAAAAWFGSVLGTMLGTGEAMRLVFGGTAGMPLAAAVTVLAAAAAAVLGGRLAGGQPAAGRPTT